MLTLITENIATIVICAILLGIVAAILVGIARDKKKGKSACGCGCKSCPMSDSCNREK